jgi:cytochrome c553
LQAESEAFLVRTGLLSRRSCCCCASAPRPNGIAQCQPCHSRISRTTRRRRGLAGISYEYLVTTMRDFVTEERGNGDMPKFMQALTDSERDANGALSLRT